MIYTYLFQLFRARLVRLIATLVPLGVALLVIAAGVFFLVMIGGQVEQLAQAAEAETHCVQQVEAGDVPTMDGLTEEQTQNAATVLTEMNKLGVPEYGQVIAIAVAWQESKLVNVEGGDRDSSGLFQQRPSTGWGTLAQVNDPVLATQAFVGEAAHTANKGLLDVPGWQQMSVGEAGQAVQASADPTGSWYAEHELFAREVVSTINTDTDTSTGSEDDPVPTVRVVSANIKSGVPDAAYLADLRRATALDADFITLQEANQKPAAVITPPGYDSYRSEENPYLKETPVLWRTDRWRKVDTGSRMTSVNTLHWGPRGVNWVTAQRIDGGQVVSVVSVHNLTHGFPDRPIRYAEYGEAMGVLQELVTELAAQGAVILAGDFNIHYAEDRRLQLANWPRARFANVGVQTVFDTLGVMETGDHGATIDYVWYHAAGLTPVDQGTYPQISDHRGLWADLTLTDGGLPPMSGTQCGTGTALDCPPTPWPEIEEGLTPDALRVMRCVYQQFPEVTSYLGVGDRASNSDSSHTTGRAVDAMITDYDTPAGQALGEQVAEWVRQNAAGMGVNYVIWDSLIWSADRADEGWRPYTHPSGADDDNSAHRNHVHVDVYGDSAGGGPAGSWTHPVQPGTYVLTARFGECSVLWEACHTGLDFDGADGTPILAAAAGTVIETGDAGPYGNMTKIDHGGGVETWYAHQSTITVQVGQTVQTGEPIGTMGSTGNSTGAHLHLEIREAGVPVDPEPYLTQRGVQL